MPKKGGLESLGEKQVGVFFREGWYPNAHYALKSHKQVKGRWREKYEGVIVHFQNN